MAKAHDRDFIGIEVNEEYKTLIEERVGPEIDAASARRVARAADELI
jgi:DNA modification methylase